MSNMLAKSDVTGEHVCASCDHKGSRFRTSTRRSRRKARAIEKRQWSREWTA